MEKVKTSMAKSNDEGEPRGLAMSALPCMEESNLDDDLEMETRRENVILPISIEEALGDYINPMGCYESRGEGQIDIRRLLDMRKWFDNFMPLTQFDRNQINWKQASRRWIWLPEWNWQESEQWHFYVDGSQQGDKLGGAAILYIKAGDFWYFGGYHYEGVPSSESLGTNLSSYDAELFAQAMAAKWAITMRQLHEFHYQRFPDLSMRPRQEEELREDARAILATHYMFWLERFNKL